MLAIRLQRTGRSGNTQFRVIVQDSRFSPTRGRIVAHLGSYDPHNKTAALDSVKAAQYLENGAQPSDRVARLFQKEGIKLPDWVRLNQPKQRAVRHPEKRRSTRPAGMEAPASTEPVEESEPAAEAPATEAPAPAEAAAEKPAEAVTDSEPTEKQAAAESPAAEVKADPSEAETATEDKPAEPGA